MAKFYGKIGFAHTSETRAGIWEEKIVERFYYGDFLRQKVLRTGSKVNTDIDISNQISIIADPFARDNFAAMRFVELGGAKWKIDSVEIVAYPRLLISLGGLYHENT